MLSDEQHCKMAHMIGLDGRTRKPYRNYYCSGREQDSPLDDLVRLRMAILKKEDITMGGNYYHLNSRGLSYILSHPEIFDMDKRIKKLETLLRKCN